MVHALRRAARRIELEAARRRKEPAAAGPRPQVQRRLARLPQHDEVWQVGIAPFPDWIVEDNQRGVNSRYYVPGPFSGMEAQERRFVDWYLGEIA